MSNIKVFEDKKIRTQWNADEEDWYFSVVDVVEALTDSVDPTAYWRKLKQRLKEEGNETVTNCHALKMIAKDGKNRLTDVVNTKNLLRLFQCHVLSTRQSVLFAFQWFAIFDLSNLLCILLHDRNRLHE